MLHPGHVRGQRLRLDRFAVAASAASLAMIAALAQCRHPLRLRLRLDRFAVAASAVSLAMIAALAQRSALRDTAVCVATPTTTSGSIASRSLGSALRDTAVCVATPTTTSGSIASRDVVRRPPRAVQSVVVGFAASRATTDARARSAPSIMRRAPW